MRRATLVILLGSVVGQDVPAASAGGSRDLADAWLVAVEAIGDRPEPPWEITLATGRLFSVAELEQKRVSGRLTRSGWRASAAWERLGDGLYVEDMLRLHADVGRRRTIGIEGGADRLALAGAAARTWPAVAVHAATDLGRGLRIDVWSHLHAAPPWYGRKGLRRLASLGGRHPAWAWAVVLDRSVDGYPALQAEVDVRVATIARLGLRFDPWSGAVGLSTTWRLGVGYLRTSHLVHPDLGTTHRWALVLGAKGAP